MENELVGIWALSNTMKEALRSILRDPAISINAKTARALVARKLLTEEGVLTQSGWDHAVEHLPLEEQCEMLSLPLTVHQLADRISPPEQAAIELLGAQGIEAHFTENTFGVHIPHFLAYPVTRRAELKHGGQLYSLSPLSRIDERSALQQASRQASSLININVVRRTFSEVDRRRRADESFFTDLWPLEFYEQLLDRLGQKTLAAIVDLVASDIDTFRTGWPDLLCFRDSAVFFVEVKTSDRFHLSQIRTIPRLKRNVGISIECWRISG